MSDESFASLTRSLHEAIIGAAWAQWQALGAQAAAPRPPSAVVDPEALVLASLWLTDDEPRMRDFLTGFAELGPRLLSVQRVKQAMRLYPADSEARVAGFAAEIQNFGKDPRWRKLAGAAHATSGRPGKVGPASTRMGEPGSLMLRLRTAFGVDVRTDTLTYLIGRRGAWADVREVSEALLYAKYSVRNACEALADARLIDSRAGRPIKYYAEPRRWAAFLGLADLPQWHPWVAVYAFVLRLKEWLSAPGIRGASPSLAASLAREFMLENGEIMKQLQLDVPDERDYLGHTYLPAFEQAVMGLVGWLVEQP